MGIHVPSCRYFLSKYIRLVSQAGTTYVFIGFRKGTGSLVSLVKLIGV